MLIIRPQRGRQRVKSAFLSRTVAGSSSRWTLRPGNPTGKIPPHMLAIATLQTEYKNLFTPANILQQNPYPHLSGRLSAPPKPFNMLAFVFLLPLLTASSVVASVKDDLGNAFKGLGLNVWEDILDVLSQTLVDELVNLLTGESGRTFLVPEYVVLLPLLLSAL